jgi:predicted aspartyl protease
VGVFYVDCEIRNSESRGKSVLVKRLLVDSGAEYTWVSESLLAKAAIRVRKKDIPFLMANGRTITRNVGYAIIRAQGFETVDEVVFAHPGDLQLLGSRTLEGFAAVVDSRRKKLVAAGPIPAAKAIREHS